MHQQPAPAPTADQPPRSPTALTPHETPWRDASRPAHERVADLMSRMTLEESVGQLVGVWVGVTADGEGVAPHQHDLADDAPTWEELLSHGIGQLTRVFGTRPVHPAAGMRALAATQREVVAANRFGIPALAHEECLAGFTAWGATIFPVPLSWGASFNPELVHRMAQAIGTSMRAVGVHQGLAPVLDVVRDLRWGRVEETIGEDPFLVGSVGAAYVAGLESTGIVSTLKHFAGYSASRAARNLAPVSMGPREFADVLLPPFERALRQGGARSVMASYTEVDGSPSTSDTALLTTLLRDRWGFPGTVVSDYFGISFLHLLHGVAEGPGDAAALALSSGVDVELPSARCYGAPLIERIRSGRVAEALVDRAVERVLRQKCALGLLDSDWTPEPEALRHGAQSALNLDPEESRSLARELAEQAVVLLANDAGVLPVAGPGRVAVIGPLADDPLGLQGCYSFPAHVGVAHPDWGMGVAVPTILEAFTEGLGASEVVHRSGCPVREEDRAGIPEAVAAAAQADLCVVALGDRAGLFGRGTSGEGCDATDLRLPGVQEELLEAVLATGTPVILVMVSGRPYALGCAAGRAAAIVQAFFPGEEGAAALTDILTGRVEPSGRLPVSVPRTAGGQPGTYLTQPLGQASEVSALDPTALYPFGHGLSYTSVSYRDLVVSEAEHPAQRSDGAGDIPDVPVDGLAEITCTVTNDGQRAVTEVVQLYLGDPVAQVPRPVRQLAGFARVPLRPGQSRRVCFRVHADLTSFTGQDLERVVEPGLIKVHVGRSSGDTPLDGGFRLVGPVRRVGRERVLDTTVVIR